MAGMKKADIVRIKKDITDALQKYAGVSPARTKQLMPLKGLQGKLYEAHVFTTICKNFVIKENLQLTLVNGSQLQFKQKGSPINRSYPFVEVRKKGVLTGELWTDIYFNTLSHHLRQSPTPCTFGDYHELDIALVDPGLSNFPRHDQIQLAVECKNTPIKRSIIREVLGFRRELSYYDKNINGTSFKHWPVSGLPANPPSVHMLYCSDKNVFRYKKSCSAFGILLEHYRM
jgi:hypothetical protein